ncbi:methylmalonyl-CoA epimerase [Deferribacter autotrophicus]|uniref:Methylmalonyl-CoA epimerase n=1 Tax=Deferribacter autotrophicus TaxID=500465 RepID=A0A5A8F8I7_9BACT|nr:methylmalonyl-CoA epimerase [Deferribacter autotrophicus]KAA0258573.1 methylmalonyl-CoA epimerase [Deferribacter autotrophicus]
MLKKIDHIGIAVKNLDNSLKIYETIGVKPYHFEEVESQKVKTAFIKVGESNIELLEPTSEESPIAKFIEKKGEGIHHIAYLVDDVQLAIDTLKNAGFKLIDETPKPGAHGKLIAFVHPKSTNGVLTELCQHAEKH